MLERFSVENFKNFKDEIIFDLSTKKNYEFNTNTIQVMENTSIVKTSLIYGINGSGKSNLGLALFDIVLTLTDKERSYAKYNQYINLYSDKIDAKFYYRFVIDNQIIEYRYSKLSSQKLLSEELKINDKLVLFYNHETHVVKINLAGAENLNTDLSEKNISFVKYVHSNTVLANTTENVAFRKFMVFVDNMLLFSSLENNHYQGFKSGPEAIPDSIIKRGLLKEFEFFLHNADINYKLVESEVDDKKAIMCDFNGKLVNFYSVASRGTCCLALFFYWLHDLDDVSFVFIDEFDAFYHNKLAMKVVEEVIKRKSQAIISTHNTSIMTNEILRPDCLYNLRENTIEPFNKLTSKELRKAHNLEKMYKGGSFGT